jgi:lipopolysaccharide/colanic/teichoic acid biosynthesis glycosyltransferase
MARPFMMADDPRSLPDQTDGSGPTLKRILDIVAASAALVVVAPVLLLAALAICIEDGWPILFFQTRLGQYGEEFVLYKFRKFRKRNLLGSSPLTLRDDPRLTRVGRFLERSKIDELPQLWNVLRGNMAVVGPRPETPHFSDCFEGSHRELLSYKPGIFGPSQAVFRNESTLHEEGRDPEQFYRDVLFPMKARLDLAYFPHCSVRLDARWAVRCVMAVIGVGFLPDAGADLASQVESCLELLVYEAKR